MKLDELLSLVSSNPAVGVRIDSRQVQPGDVFVAIQGASCDGHQFIGQAVANGARYIVCETTATVVANRCPLEGRVSKARPYEEPARIR